MKKLVAVGALALTLVGTLGIPAQANTTPGCVTRAEFRRVRIGMTARQVRNIYGTTGRINLLSPPIVIRSYRTCVRFHVTNVSYWNGRVDSKLFI